MFGVCGYVFIQSQQKERRQEAEAYLCKSSCGLPEVSLAVAAYFRPLGSVIILLSIGTS